MGKWGIEEDETVWCGVNERSVPGGFLSVCAASVVCFSSTSSLLSLALSHLDGEFGFICPPIFELPKYFLTFTEREIRFCGVRGIAYIIMVCNRVLYQQAIRRFLPAVSGGSRMCFGCVHSNFLVHSKRKTV